MHHFIDICLSISGSECVCTLAKYEIFIHRCESFILDRMHSVHDTEDKTFDNVQTLIDDHAPIRIEMTAIVHSISIIDRIFNIYNRFHRKQNDRYQFMYICICLYVCISVANTFIGCVASISAYCYFHEMVLMPSLSSSSLIAIQFPFVFISNPYMHYPSMCVCASAHCSNIETANSACYLDGNFAPIWYYCYNYHYLVCPSPFFNFFISIISLIESLFTPALWFHSLTSSHLQWYE